VRLLVEEANARAIPKSLTLTVPSSVRSMFWGLMSRWTTPLLWTCRNPRATCVAISAARCHGEGLSAADVPVQRVGDVLHDAIGGAVFHLEVMDTGNMG